jgi:hypothetical protein
MSKEMFKNPDKLIEVVNQLNKLMKSMVEKEKDLDFEYKYKLTNHTKKIKDLLKSKELQEVRKKEVQIDLMIRSAEDLISGYETWIDQFIKDPIEQTTNKDKKI